MSGALSQGPGGGIIPPGQAGVGNPMEQQYIQRMAQVPTEQLQEMAARSGGTPQGIIAQRLLQQRHMMPNAQTTQPSPAPTAAPVAPTSNAMQPGTGIAQTPQATAAGISLPPTSNAMRRGGGIAREREHFDMGGMAASQEDPWWTRKESSGASGLIHAYSPGRTDTINMEPLAGSYVVPADVIAGLGEDNTLAGAAVMDRVLGSGPFGTTMPRGTHGRGPPAPPRQPAMHEATGGPQAGQPGERVPIVAAGGEYVVSPEQVARIGGGNMKRGHDILDRFVLEVRKRANAKRAKLPPPKKN